MNLIYTDSIKLVLSTSILLSDTRLTDVLHTFCRFYFIIGM